MATKKVTIEQLEQALKAHGGWQTQAAKALGISFQAVSKRVNQSERLQQVVAEVKAQYLDLAESRLMQKIKDGDLGAICFYLKCQGKERGYVEKQHIDNTSSDGSMSPPQRIEIVPAEFNNDEETTDGSN